MGLRWYLSVTAAYWGFTLTDGALRMLVLLHFFKLGYSPFTLAFLFLLYEAAGIVESVGEAVFIFQGNHIVFANAASEGITGYSPSVLAKRLIDVTREAMFRGIRMVKPGATLGDIGHAIQSYAEAERFSVVREYCGHGIGQIYHEDPQVLHYGRPGEGVRLQEGMTFTIEPMINAGARHTKLLPDGWTVVTKDKSLSAQWEHTVAVTRDGVEILTRLPGDDNDL